MTANETYIKHWNKEYDTEFTPFGEGKAPPHAIAAMKEYAKQKCEIQRALCSTEAIKNFYIDDEQMNKILHAIEPTFD